MILDALLQFTGGSPNSGTVATVFTATQEDAPGAGTTTGSNIIDLHATNALPVLANLQGARDMDIGDKPALKMVAWVSVAFSTGTSLQVNLTGATDNGSGAPAAFSVWWGTPVYPIATLVAGARMFDMDFPRPPAGVAIPRFLQLQYVGVGALNGRLKSWIVIDRMDQPYQGTSNAILGGYPAGVTIAN